MLDLEPATGFSSSMDKSEFPSNWNNRSQLHPSNILARLGRLPLKGSCIDWLTYAEDTLHHLAAALIPSFLQRYVSGEPPVPSKLHAIAALDGLRGWACLLVFNFHFLFTYTWKVAVGWGFAEGNFWIHQLPFFHLLVSGHIMVAIFFVLSGYVLCYKPIKTIHQRNFDQTFKALASSTFRRALRLYIPSIIGLICVFVAVRIGFYNYSWVVIKEGHTIRGTNEQHPPIYRSPRKQFWDLYSTIAVLLNPFDWGLFYNNYNPHLWTIPVEFRCSLVVFLTTLGTSRLPSTIRMVLIVCLICFCMRHGRWDVVMFLFGMLMAEADLINGTWEEPAHQISVATDKQIRIRFTPGGKVVANISRRRFWIAVFLLGLYIGSSPNLGYKWTPGYMWLWHITPKTYGEPHRFPQTIGAALIVFGINRSPDIQKLFTNRLSQYLGKISYSFYIVHGPILHSIGYSIMPTIWNITGKETNVQYCFGFLIGWLICLSLSIWAGDLFWRAVDIPSVKFARVLEDRLVALSASASTRPISSFTTQV